MIIPNPTWLPYLDPYNFGNERVTSGPPNELKNDPKKEIYPHQVKTVIGVIDGVKKTKEIGSLPKFLPTFSFQ